MSELKGFSLSGRALVTEDFLKGIVPTIDPEGFLVDLGFGRKIDLAPLREVVEEAMRRFEHEPSESDSWLGPRVHATLRLTRREASDKRVWAFLNIVEFPEYVRWRWLREDKKLTLNRLWGQDNLSAMARLWWAAELVRNGSDYQPASEALKINRFFQWQGLNYIHHRAGAIGAAKFLAEFGEEGITRTEAIEMFKAVNFTLRTISLDALAASPPTDAFAVREWIAGKIDVTTMLDELPVGPDEEPVPDVEIAKVRRFLDDLAERIKLGEVKTEKRKKQPATTT